MHDNATRASSATEERLIFYREAWLNEFLSKHTRQAYGYDLAAFAAWCKERDVDIFAGVQRAHVNAYARKLEEAGAKAATVARAQSAVSSFYNYLIKYGEPGLVQHNPAAAARRPKVSDESQTASLDEHEARALIVTAAKDSPRSTILVALLLVNGLRIGEVVAANVADLDMENGCRILRVTQKGGKRRAAPLLPPIPDVLDAYLAGRTDGPLVTTKTGRRIDQSHAWRLTRRLAKDAGIANADGISPMALRHTYATLSLDAGIPLHVVQDAMGHADTRSTQRYNRRRHQRDDHPARALAAALLTP